MAGQNYIWVVSWRDGNYEKLRKAFVSKVQALQFKVKLRNDRSCYNIDLKKSFDGG